MKKTVWVFSLIVMLLSQIITPFAYAVSGEEIQTQLVEKQEIETTVEHDVITGANEPVQEPEKEIEIPESVKTWEFSWDNFWSISWVVVPEVQSGVQSWMEDEISSWDNGVFSWDFKCEEKNLEEEEILTWVESSSWFIEKITETIKDFLWINWEEDESFESKEIYGTWEYEWVMVEVYAQTWLFLSWTKLIIEAVTWDMMEEVKQVLSWEVEVEEEGEKQTMIAFNITFRDPETEEELQPRTWTVQVTFNYEDNEILKQAEEDEEQEIKVYHLNDIDEEENKIEELTWIKVEKIEINEEESKEWKLVVDAESFSIYLINNISLKWIWDTITFTYDANWWQFSDWETIKYVEYSYGSWANIWKEYSHTSNIGDDWTLNSSTYSSDLASKHVVTIPWATKLYVSLKYATETNWDYLYVFKWTYTWTPTKNMSAWQLYTFNWDSNNTLKTSDFYIDWDTVTFAFYSDGSVQYYWYYAVIIWIWDGYVTSETIENPTKEWELFFWWYETWSDIEYDFSWTVTENKTLYAKRDSGIRTVKYDANGWIFNTWNMLTGEVNVYYMRQDNWIYNPDTNIPIPNRNAVEWENCSWWMFDGWYTTDTNQTTERDQEVTDTTPSEVIVYAKWLPFNDKIVTMWDFSIILMDRNMWATDYTSWCTYLWCENAPQQNLPVNWKIYQWWNNYWFPNYYTYTKTSTVQVSSVAWYWPWNPYYSNIFVKNSNGWYPSSSNNLWWWSNSENLDSNRQWPCPKGYHVPTRYEWDTALDEFKMWKNTNEWSNYCNSLKAKNSSRVVSNDNICFPSKFWLPFANYLSKTSAWWSYPDNYGYYWTTTHNGWNYNFLLYFNSSEITTRYGDYSSRWASVRCFKDTYRKPLVFNTNWGNTITSPNIAYKWFEWWEKLPTPTKSWKIFAWRYRTPDFQGSPQTVNSFTEYESWGSINLYAKRRDPNANITILFNANWGYFSWWELIKQVEYSEQIESWNYVWNINIQAPNKDFEWDIWYMFDWWYVDTNYTREWDWVTSETLSWQIIYAKRLPFKDMSVTLSWTTITLMDRNLWATVVWWWNTAWSYGKYYQWWNNYWFSNDVSNIKTSDFQVDAAWYWPWNYYYSNIFIKNSNWRQSWWYWRNNVSLWNWEWPCPKWYHIPSISEWSRLRDLFKSWMASEWSTYCNSLQYTSEWACFSEKLKIPIAWYFSPSLSFTSSYWYYWSTTHNYWTQAYQFSDYGLENGAYIYTANSYGLSNAMSLRCFKDPSITLTLVLDNWENDLVISWVKWREPVSNYKPNEPIKLWYWFEWWYDENWDRYDFPKTTYLSESKTLYARYLGNTWYIFDANWWEFENWNSTVEVQIMLSNWKFIPAENIPKIKKEKTSYVWLDGEIHYTWWMFDWWYTTPTNQTTEWLWQRDSEVVNTKKVYAKWLPFEDLEVTMWWTTFTIMDRNLWAEDVAEWIFYPSNWHEDNSKLWHYYQWWNNYWFSNEGTIANSWFELVINPNHQTSPWWPWNYYYDDKFIKRSSSPYRWDSEKNLNLWWWQNSSNSDIDKQWPCPEWYHVPDKWEWQLVIKLFNREKASNTNYCTWDNSEYQKCIAAKLKLPFAGERIYSSADLSRVWKVGTYWSSSYDNSYSNYDSEYSWRFHMAENNRVEIDYGWYRTYGLPVRCFKNVSNTLTLNPNNWWNTTSMIVRWRDLLSNIKPLKPIKDWYRFIWWYDWDSKFIFSWFLEESKLLDARWEESPVYTYNATSGSFESGTVKTIKYLVNNLEVSHTPNIDDEGNKLADYENNLNLNDVVTVSSAKDLHIRITYWWEWCCDWVSMWTWSHPGYSASNYESYYPASVLDYGWRLMWWNYTSSGNTKDYYVSWDTVTFAYKSDWSSCWGDGNWYWYYAIISDASKPLDGIYYSNEEIESPIRYWYLFSWWYETWATESFDITWTEVTQDRTLYAKWEPIEYTINYHSNTWDDTIVTQWFVYDIEQKLSKNNYAYDGYKFLWWNTQEDWLWTWYYDEQWVLNLTWADGSEIDLYAQWGKLVNIVFKDGDAVLTWYDIVVWEQIVLPEKPTSETYIFVKWDWLPEDWRAPDEDLILTAIWTQNSPAAWWGRMIEQRIKEEKQEHESAEEKQEEKEIKQDNQQDNQQDETVEEQTKTPEKNNTTSNQSTTQNSSSSSKENTVTVDPEILSAYEWAYENNITTITSLDEANPDWPVTRGHLAKMVVNYVTNVLGQEIPEKIPSECRWNDWRWDWESEEIKDYAVKSCALWLMWLDMDKFLPNMQVTRAQFGTIMSRLLWWKKYAWWTPYYRKHLNALKENGIMTQIENPERRVELRQWVWVMLMRSAQNK